MKSKYPPPTDRIVLTFRARGDPLAEGDSGLDPFFDALETHAREWLPEKVASCGRKYSRAATLKSLKEFARKNNTGPCTSLSRESPFVRMSVDISRVPSADQFSVFMSIWGFDSLAESARAKEESGYLMNLVRAWASAYPVTHAYVHVASDINLAHDWDIRRAHLRRTPTDEPDEAPREWVRAIFWLNVFGKGWVDGLGRERVLSTPAHLVEELPNGAVLLVTRPTLADWRSDEARQAQAKAFVHLRPELDLDTVLGKLRERSALLAPVDPRFDPDMVPLLQRIVDERFEVHERPRKTAEFNAYRPPEVDEWLPANTMLPSDVADPAASIDVYEDWADVLSVMLHPDVEDYFKAPPEALTDIDFRLWWEKFPEFYEREKIDRKLFPAVGAYLGCMLVRHLGGRWVPRQNLLESQVVVGDRAWLPFLRSQRYLQSTQALLDYSLTKFFRVAERHHAGQNVERRSGKS